MCRSYITALTLIVVSSICSGYFGPVAPLDFPAHNQIEINFEPADPKKVIEIQPNWIFTALINQTEAILEKAGYGDATILDSTKLPRIEDLEAQYRAKNKNGQIPPHIKSAYPAYLAIRKHNNSILLSFGKILYVRNYGEVSVSKIIANMPEDIKMYCRLGSRTYPKDQSQERKSGNSDELILFSENCEFGDQNLKCPTTSPLIKIPAGPPVTSDTIYLCKHSPSAQRSRPSGPPTRGKTAE